MTFVMVYDTEFLPASVGNFPAPWHSAKGAKVIEKARLSAVQRFPVSAKTLWRNR